MIPQRFQKRAGKSQRQSRSEEGLDHHSGGSHQRPASEPGGSSVRKVKPAGTDALYRLLVESVKDYAIFALDRDGRVMSWNPGAERFKGYHADEIIGQHFSIFYPADDLAAGKPQRELEVAEETGRFEDEGWRIRKDGSRFWANVVITALRDAKGEHIGFSKVTRDLTARREAEEQGRRLAAETAAHSVAEEKRRDLSVLMQRLQEYTDELEAQTEEGQVLIEKLEQSNNELQAALALAEEAREAATTAEHRERLARGRADQVQQLTTALSAASTAMAVADAVISGAERAFPSATGIVVATCGDGSDELELVKASDMPEALFDEWRRIPLDAPVPLTEVARTGESILMESPADWWARYPDLAPLVEKTGHRAQIVVPLIAAGRCIGALGIAFREPRHFAFEEQEFAASIAGQCAVALERARLFGAERAARAEAETANMAKGEFLAAMSHELRTPLNAIAGHIELLTMDIYGAVTEPQREALERVRRAQQHLLGLINDLLNFARLERGKLEYRLETVRLQDVVADLAPMIEPQVAARGLQYELRLPAAPVEVVADREKLVQILLNLLSNAVKFTPKDGTVSVDVPERSDGSQPTDTVFIRVTDTGVGIPREKLQAIFDPFVQLSAGLANRRDGTGLGLTISRDLARGMGGDLRARSAAGESTTFTLALRRSGMDAEAS